MASGFFVWISEYKHSKFLKILNREMKAGNYRKEIFSIELRKPLYDLFNEYLIFRSYYFSN